MAQQYYLPDHRYTARKPNAAGAFFDDVTIHCADTYSWQDIGVADIRKWHVNENGWIDCGYHFVIRRDGSLEIGRPVWALGAGVAGWNERSVHICLVGGKASKGGPEDNFTAAQWRTLKSLVITLRALDDGAERVIGHRDYPGVTKYCPSFDVAAWLKRNGL